MKLKNIFIYSILLLIFSFAFIYPAYANKASAKIVSPDVAKKGEIITIEINVFHKGNSYFHHVDWVYVKVNNKEIARWDFTANDRPKTENFTREITIKVEKPVTVVAEAHCNLHGSAGAVEKNIDVK